MPRPAPESSGGRSARRRARAMATVVSCVRSRHTGPRRSRSCSGGTRARIRRPRHPRSGRRGRERSPAPAWREPRRRTPGSASAAHRTRTGAVRSGQSAGHPSTPARRRRPEPLATRSATRPPRAERPGPPGPHPGATAVQGRDPRRGLPHATQRQRKREAQRLTTGPCCRAVRVSVAGASGRRRCCRAACAGSGRPRHRPAQSGAAAVRGQLCARPVATRADTT